MERRILLQNRKAGSEGFGLRLSSRRDVRRQLRFFSQKKGKGKAKPVLPDRTCFIRTFCARQPAPMRGRWTNRALDGVIAGREMSRTGIGRTPMTKFLILLGAVLSAPLMVSTLNARDLRDMEPGSTVGGFATRGSKQIPLPNGQWELVVLKKKKRVVNALSKRYPRRLLGRRGAYGFVGVMA